MTMNTPLPGGGQLIPAAQYVRMSTEHQQYSTCNQEDVIREYAAKRGYELVKTYADEGKSGLNVAGRECLRQMIDDVQSGRANFRAILVYDVSRWGASRMPMRAPTTSTSASGPGSKSIIVRSNSKTTVHRLRPSSRA